MDERRYGVEDKMKERQTERKKEREQERNKAGIRGVR